MEVHTEKHRDTKGSTKRDREEQATQRNREKQRERQTTHRETQRETQCVFPISPGRSHFDSQRLRPRERGRLYMQHQQHSGTSSTGPAASAAPAAPPCGNSSTCSISWCICSGRTSSTCSAATSSAPDQDVAPQGPITSRSSELLRSPIKLLRSTSPPCPIPMQQRRSIPLVLRDRVLLRASTLQAIAHARQHTLQQQRQQPRVPLAYHGWPRPLRPLPAYHRLRRPKPLPPPVIRCRDPFPLTYGPPPPPPGPPPDYRPRTPPPPPPGKQPTPFLDVFQRHSADIWCHPGHESRTPL